MMKRSPLGSTVIVFCDTDGCTVCWTYDAYCASFSAARRAAIQAGWECVRTAEGRRDTCRWCLDERPDGPAPDPQPIPAAAA